MSNIEFLPVTDDQISAILSIYNYYVLNSTATFHKHPLSRGEMKAILFSENPRYPSYVIYDDGNIVGYCLLKRFHVREAYDGTGEVTVYLNPANVRQGLGGLAVDFLEEFAVKNDFHTLIAIICAENEGSIKMFAKKGYEKCGHFREVGKKFGRLLDVVYYQKILE